MSKRAAAANVIPQSSEGEMLVLLAAFVAGVAGGIIAGLSYIVRQRREILGLKRELRLRNQVARAGVAGEDI